MKNFILLAGMALTGVLASCNQQAKKNIAKAGIIVPDHIIIVIEENHGYDQIIGSTSAPYINELANTSAVFTNSHGVTHPSQPNYLAFFSGSTQGIPDDQCLQDKTPYTTPNLGAALIKNGYSFKGFAQTMPSPGFLDCSYLKGDLTGGTLYARKHAPWVNWQGNKENNIPDSVSQPMTAFPKDFDQLPTVAFVIPDQDHDMHNIGTPGDSAAIKRGDDWLKENLGAYVEWAKTHNSLLILTYDEDQFTPQNHILTIFAGANIKPGKYDEKIDHYSILNTMEAMYDLRVTDTTNAFVIKDIWEK
ncbi:MAG: alkaline phosphatase family protein [Bacteroidota bacterium]|nr:alkaline phosphatase family protein [Bacteroidota bacterium]